MQVVCLLHISACFGQTDEKNNKSLRRKKKKEICNQVKLTIQKEAVNKVEE